ncbi:2-C-methyl-D-erythritol 4-phosphate cytidylyltransferase [Ramlibacter sp. XY19]|uniref:IspD/TarI family cytidylyltransferase n=1 Tax=Ramlibacter paludis TaxID=2908000 RepID=UPI0023DA918D|nr:2-C-methyl-D-erythritol 4-phosphate cytidylyltransferase [Ramlibacter paludis]
MTNPADVSVLIPAAGAGERLGQGPKAWLPLAGRPLVEWVAAKGRQLGVEVLVACAPGMPAPTGTIAVEGGATRQDSVLRLAARATRPWSLLWDAASPFASLDLCRSVLAAAVPTGAAVAYLPALVTGLDVRDGRVIAARAADGSGSTQTPQAYASELLRKLTTQAQAEGWRTQSTAELVLRAGLPLAAVPGERLNIKLTTPDDWILAQALLDRLHR